MKCLLFQTATFAALTLVGMSALAQDRDRDRDDRYRDDDQYHQGARDQSYWQNQVFARVRADIDHIQSVAAIFSGEQFRLAKAKQELNELQNRATSGNFNDQDLDDVIGALQRVVADNRLGDRDREMLSDDVARLREVREHHDRYYRPRG